MKEAHDATTIEEVPDARVAILQAKWHAEHTDAVVEAAVDLLEKARCECIDSYQVPGCYELPLAAKHLAALQKYDALIIVGAIVKGETDHYQVILDTCVRELGRVMYDFEIPIIMEVMPVHDIEHLKARCTGEHNKGIEAALACAEIIAWHRDIAEG